MIKRFEKFNPVDPYGEEKWNDKMGQKLNEIIKNIEETTFIENIDGDEYNFDGYVITTEEQLIKIGIENEQNCCEHWGYLSSDDDFSHFIGAKIIDIDLTDEALKSIKVKLKKEKLVNNDDRGTNIIFVNVNTDRGLLQFSVYNNHNGYYGHKVAVLADQIEIDREL
jgi:hypothetical protein